MKIAALIWLEIFLLWGTAAFAQNPGQIDATALDPIGALTQREIQLGRIPGAVVLVGNPEEILYRKAFGLSALKPEPRPMTVDTRFDLASLTKVVATTTAILQLMDQQKLRLDDPVAKYWPEFGENHKESITIRQLLTHYSGLRADLDLTRAWWGYPAALSLIAAEKPLVPPGSQYLYSDINFEILGELVRRISGMPLDVYCARYIFQPLGMKNTGFTPPLTSRPNIAPTEYLNGRLHWGEVHDPTAYRMGGVSGHAGLFSTADDLAIFARMLLDGGSAKGVRILNRRTVTQMTTPQSPPGMTELRGLGWALAAPFATNREQLLPLGAYGHLGYTGTLLRIDPVTRTFLIVLSNRVHPHGKGNANPLRRGILAIVSAALGPQTNEQILAARPGVAAYRQRAAAYPVIHPATQVATGLDVLKTENFAPLKGLRVGLITNQTGVDTDGNRGVDLLFHAPGVSLTKIFSPEHGLQGNRDGKIPSERDAGTGLPVYSLYGETRKPTEGMLRDIDALVFDIQDAGVRFYTYATTMAYAMEAAARRNIDFYVLDRPDPIAANIVQGPMLEATMTSFTSYFPLPVRHGMTIGELARLFNQEGHIGARLHVIEMRGYRRRDWYDETGIPWIPPSPNLRTLTEATLYPGVALVEGANVSVGRGTDTPFELLGAPWIDGRKLADALNRRDIAGVFFIPANFTPDDSRYVHQPCHGVRLLLTDRRELDSPFLGIELASTLHQLYPEQFHTKEILSMVGSPSWVQAITDGKDPRSIAPQWQEGLREFSALRKRFLLY
ncbi:exo-beta-N-acetylmuramidase NamZ domain-containing protein [Ferrovum sp.]|uniref:exo-beta-N-acetylmuramidase NamZ domain-containing protein n=1 Tax=Ferrovum sp. TaxID=2609467 RepID=UPI002617AEB2|nr:exo-beta-N-acetylmuramidase NamZ domain-containing protein [Ferrovum sp.]